MAKIPLTKKQKKTIKEEIVAPKYNKNQRFVPLAQEKRETIEEEIEKLIYRYFKQWWQEQDGYIPGSKLGRTYEEWAKEIARLIVLNFIVRKENPERTIKEGVKEIIEREWRPNNGVPPSFVADQIYALFRQTLQRFIEETKVEEITAQNDRLGLKSKNNYKNGFNEALDEIKEKQQRWLRENL